LHENSFTKGISIGISDQYEGVENMYPLIMRKNPSNAIPAMIMATLHKTTLEPNKFNLLHKNTPLQMKWNMNILRMYLEDTRNISPRGHKRGSNLACPSLPTTYMNFLKIHRNNVKKRLRQIY